MDFEVRQKSKVTDEIGRTPQKIVGDDLDFPFDIQRLNSAGKGEGRRRCPKVLTRNRVPVRPSNVLSVGVELNLLGELKQERRTFSCSAVSTVAIFAL